MTALRARAPLPADLERLKLAVLSLNIDDQIQLREHLAQMVRETNEEVCLGRHGTARWKIGQLVRFWYNGTLQYGVLIGGGVRMRLWRTGRPRGTMYSLPWSDAIALAEAPEVEVIRTVEDGLWTPTLAGVKRARAYVNALNRTQAGARPTDRRRPGSPVAARR